MAFPIVCLLLDGFFDNTIMKTTNANNTPKQAKARLKKFAQKRGSNRLDALDRTESKSPDCRVMEVDYVILLKNVMQ